MWSVNASRIKKAQQGWYVRWSTVKGSREERDIYTQEYTLHNTQLEKCGGAENSSNSVGQVGNNEHKGHVAWEIGGQATVCVTTTQIYQNSPGLTGICKYSHYKAN